METDVGFEYLSTGPSVTNLINADKALTGLRVVDIATMESRTRTEMSKYYHKDIQTKIKLAGHEVPLVATVNESPLHFAPSVGRVGGKSFFFTEEGSDLWNVEQNNLMASKIISYKKTGNVPTSLKEGRTENTALMPYEQTTQTLLEESLENNNLSEPRYNRLMSYIASKALINADIDKGRSRAQRARDRRRFRIDILDGSTPNNLYSSRFDSRPVEAIIAMMPIQLKSIAVSFSAKRSLRKLVRYDWQAMPNDPLSDPKMLNGFIVNYLLLQKVEYLSGYKVAKKALVKHPIWKPATIGALKQITDQGMDVICRLRKFEDKNIPSIREGESLDLPSYNNYFIVSAQAAPTTSNQWVRRRRRRRRGTRGTEAMLRRMAATAIGPARPSPTAVILDRGEG
jgi:hypothetical protein